MTITLYNRGYMWLTMSVMIGTKITEQEEAQIYQLVERGCFLNKSDFTRTAIRELLGRFPSVEEAKR